MTSTELFYKVMAENNLGFRLSNFVTRSMQDGAFLVEKPVLEVFYLTDPSIKKPRTKKDSNAAATKPAQ